MIKKKEWLRMEKINDEQEKIRPDFSNMGNCDLAPGLKNQDGEPGLHFPFSANIDRHITSPQLLT